MSILLSIAAFIVAIGILVTFHEFGHYWVARKMGVKVLQFSIGFGRSLYAWHGKDGVRYQIAAIPLGGYVKMLDEREDQDIDPKEIHRAFNRQPLGVRTAIVAAGPLANFLLAFILLFLMFTIGVSGMRPIIGEVQPGSIAAAAGLQVGDEIASVNGKKVVSWREASLAMLVAETGGKDITLSLMRDDAAEAPHDILLQTEPLNFLGDDGMMSVLGIGGPMPVIPAVIAEVMPGSAAQRYGLQIGDEIVAFDGKPVSDWGSLVRLVRENPTRTVELSIIRNEQLQNLSLQIDSVESERRLMGRIGARVDERRALEELQKYRIYTRYAPLTALPMAAMNAWELTSLTLKILWRLLTGSASPKNLSGPLTIAEVAGTSIAIGFGTYLGTLALLSISIGILNLLPIPMLDGGHLLYYLIEFFKGSPVSEQTQLFAQRIGLVLLGSLMLLAIYNDIYRLLQ